MHDNFDISKWNKQRILKEEAPRLDTSTFIEPEEMEILLGKIYHIISGNRRDYLNIGDDVLKCLKQFDKTVYTENDKDTYSSALSNLHKKITGEEPKATTKNKLKLPK